MTVEIKMPSLKTMVLTILAIGIIGGISAYVLSLHGRIKTLESQKTTHFIPAILKTTEQREDEKKQELKQTQIILQNMKEEERKTQDNFQTTWGYPDSTIHEILTFGLTSYNSVLGHKANTVFSKGDKLKYVISTTYCDIHDTFKCELFGDNANGNMYFAKDRADLLASTDTKDSNAAYLGTKY